MVLVFSGSSAAAGVPEHTLKARRQARGRVAFETLPVVHLDRRRLPEYPDEEPEGILTDLARAFGRVAVVDVQGIRRNEADLEFIQQAGRRRPLWVDAGSRYATDAMDLFVAGAETVTMRWNTLDSPKELEEAAEVAQHGSLLLGLEFPRGGFLKHARDARTAHEAAAFAEKLGLGLVLLVDAAADLRSLPTSTAARFVQGLPRERALAAEELGYQGALLSPSELPRDAP